MAQFAPVVDSLENASATLSETTEILESGEGDIEDIKTSLVNGLAQARESLEAAQADLTNAEDAVVGALSEMNSMLSDVDQFLGTTVTNVKSLKDTGLTTISDARSFLSTAQSDLSGVSGDLRTVSEDIESANIGGQINSTVDWLNGIINSLKLYMVISSIMFILVGAGMVLTGFYWGRMQP